MKIIHRFSIDSSGQKFCRGVAAIGGAALYGISGMYSADKTNKTSRENVAAQIAYQQEENEVNRQFTAEQAKIARDYNTEQAEISRNFEANQAALARQFTTSEREAQQNYQSQQWVRQQQMAIPLQRQSAQAAGINPNVLFSNTSAASGGSVSAPTGAASPMPSSSAPQAAAASFSNGISPVPFQAVSPAAAFAQAAQGVASLASAKEKGMNTKAIEQQINNLQVDEQYKKILLEGAQLENSLKQIKLKYEDQKILQDLREQFVNIGLATSQKDLNEAKEATEGLIQQLNASLADYHTAQADLARLELAAFWKKTNSLLNLQSEQANEARQRAEEAKANATTINEIRGWQVGFQQAVTEIQQVKSFVERNSMWQQVEAYVQELKAKEMLPEQVSTALERARKENNWFVVNQLLNCINTGAKVYGTYKGAKTGQGIVDAQNVRNSIQEEYNKFQYEKYHDDKTYHPSWPMLGY